MRNGWMRTAAAAAIVVIGAGGGWGVYTRVQQGQPARVIVMPPRMPSAGGFSGVGAIRAPETIPGPTVSQPVKAHANQTRSAKKPAAHPAATGSSTHPAPVPKSAAQPAATQ